MEKNQLSNSLISLITFLGNPGKNYEYTRHNAAWLLAEKIPFFSSLVWQEKFKGKHASFTDKGNRLTFLMPQTYMNLSGDCLQSCMSFFRIEPNEVIVVHDEIELPFGTIGFRKGGGLGGHNG